MDLKLGPRKGPKRRPRRPVRSFIVYALVCPLARQARYVGLSTRGLLRAAQHWQQADGPKTHGRWARLWLQKLRALGLRPSVQVLEEVRTGPSRSRRLRSAERRWIRRLRALGCPLTNLSDGGDMRPPKAPTRRRPGVAEANRRRTGSRLVRLAGCVPVVCWDCDEAYPSLQAAAEAHSTTRGNVWSVLAGRRDSVSGHELTSVEATVTTKQRRDR